MLEARQGLSAMDSVGSPGSSGALDYERLVVHSGRAHGDDFLSACLLVSAVPTLRKIERVPKLTDEIVNDRKAVVVDIGGRYDCNRFFDHHQNSELPCSLFLVLRDLFGYDLDKLPKWLRILDYQDRFGPEKTEEEWGVSLGDPVGKLLVDVFSTRTVITPEDPLWGVMAEVGKALRSWIERYLRARESVDLFFLTERGMVLISNDPQVDIEALKETYSPIGLIKPNSREPEKHTDVLSIDNNEWFRPERVEGFPTVFTHPTKFLRVLAIPFKELTDDVVKKIVDQATGVSGA